MKLWVLPESINTDSRIFLKISPTRIVVSPWLWPFKAFRHTTCWMSYSTTAIITQGGSSYSWEMLISFMSITTFIYPSNNLISSLCIHDHTILFSTLEEQMIGITILIQLRDKSECSILYSRIRRPSINNHISHRLRRSGPCLIPLLSGFKI